MAVLPPRKATLGALSLSIVSFLVIAIVGSQHISLTKDTPRYRALAHNLLEHGVYSSCRTGTLLPEFERLPGYPAFMALTYALGGEADYSVIFGQAMLHGLATFMLFLLAWSLTEHLGFALLTSGAWAIYPFSIYYGVMMMSEIVIASLMIVAISLLVLYGKHGARWALVASIAVTILASYTRPNIVAVPVFLSAIGMIVPRLRGSRVTRALVFMSLIVLVGQVPWVVRNYSAFGKFMVGSRNYVGLNVCESSVEFQVSSKEVGRLCMSDLPKNYHDICDFRENQRLDALLLSKGKDQLRANLSSFVALMPLRAVRVWLSWDNEGRWPFFALLALRIASLGLMVPFCWGMWLLWRKTELGWVPVGICLFISLSHMVLYVSGRYSMPARGFYWLAIAYVAWGLSRAVHALARGHFRGFEWPGQGGPSTDDSKSAARS